MREIHAHKEFWAWWRRAKGELRELREKERAERGGDEGIAVARESG